MKIELTFDTLPDPRLSANGRKVFWNNPGWESKARRQTKETFTALLRDAWNRTYPSVRRESTTMARCRLTWVLTYPQHRKRDADNMFLSLKPWQDCLVEEGLIEADDFEHIGEPTLILRVEKGVERTELTIAEVE
jgi:Holliday junction resolvase RusA-like endonuclease